MKKSNIFPRTYKQTNKKSRAKIGFEKTSDLADSKYPILPPKGGVGRNAAILFSCRSSQKNNFNSERSY